jgi:hypothetical protein
MKTVMNVCINTPPPFLEEESEEKQGEGQQSPEEQMKSV